MLTAINDIHVLVHKICKLCFNFESGQLTNHRAGYSTTNVILDYCQQ